MSPAIAEIRAGHQDITYLLRIFSRQIGAFQAGRTPELLLMRDIAACLNDYAADGCDGSERSAIEGIAREDAAAAPHYVTLTTEHAEIHRLGTTVLAVLDDIAKGLLLPRSTLVNPGRQYVRLFRNHLRHEREYFRHYGKASSHATVMTADLPTVSQVRSRQLDPLRERISLARRNVQRVSPSERVCDACDIGAG